MTKILSVTTHGTDDQTLSTFAFVTAVGAPWVALARSP